MQDFDLSLACALGACSFEAYHIAYHMHGLKVRQLSDAGCSQLITHALEYPFRMRDAPCATNPVQCT